jgi:trehalose/maltose hydrolase-like predicted phosphorylase
MDTFKDELAFIFLTHLKREPSDFEVNFYWSRFKDYLVSYVQITNEIKETSEYKFLNSEYYGDVRYIPDENFSIKVKHMNPKRYEGVIVSNGKVGLITSPVYNSGNKPFITTNYDIRTISSTKSNVLYVMDSSHVNFFNKTQSSVEVINFEQTIEMYTATYKNTYTANYTLSTGEIQSVTVENSILALRQFPYCMYNEFKIRNISGTTIDFEMYHKFVKMLDFENPVFSTNTIDNTKSFSAEALHTTSKTGVFVNNVYVGNEFQHLGYTEDSEITYNKFVHKEFQDGSEIVLGFLTGFMSTNDFKNPKDELSRILYSISKTTNFVQEHNLQWSILWKSGITIQGKLMNDANQRKLTKDLQQAIKYSLYSIYSRVRAEVNVELNPLNISAVDFDGEIFWNSDMFLVPVFNILQPKFAKMLIDYRFKQLDIAKQLASAHGYEGCKFPYKNDNTLYEDIYWNPDNKIYVFNTGMIAMNAWNYYRVTQDFSWLSEKGYKILKSSVDFFISLTQDVEDNNGKVKRFSFPNTFSLNENVAMNNLMTLYFAINTLKHCIEAFFELCYKVNDEWYEVLDVWKEHLNDLITSYTISNDKHILKLSDDYLGTHVDIAESLLLFTGNYSRTLFSLLREGTSKQYTEDNLAFYKEVTNQSLFVNQLLYMCVHGHLGQKTSISQKEHIVEFDRILQDLILNSSKPFGKLKDDAGFIYTLINGLGELRVTGLLNFNRFYVETFGIKSRSGYKLPEYIQKMKITTPKEEFVINNKIQ